MTLSPLGHEYGHAGIIFLEEKRQNTTLSSRSTLWFATISFFVLLILPWNVMELAEVSSPCFSNWVHSSSARKLSLQDSWTSKKSRKTSRQNSRISTTISLYYHRAQYTEEELKETLQRWVQNPEHEETVKLKKLVRQGVLPTLRSDLWTDASGGGDIILNSPHYYEEMIDDMGEKDYSLL